MSRPALNAGSSALLHEAAARTKAGGIQVTMVEFASRLRDLGYRLDRSLDCRSNARYTTGARAGESYPVLSVYPTQIDDGKSAWHFEARRDSHFAQLQQLRDMIFSVSNGCIVEI